MLSRAKPVGAKGPDRLSPVELHECARRRRLDEAEAEQVRPVPIASTKKARTLLPSAPLSIPTIPVPRMQQALQQHDEQRDGMNRTPMPTTRPSSRNVHPRGRRERLPPRTAVREPDGAAGRHDVRESA
jgi:hypothetical protein